jgi:hypothetical protein
MVSQHKNLKTLETLLKVRSIIPTMPQGPVASTGVISGAAIFSPGWPHTTLSRSGLPDNTALAPAAGSHAVLLLMNLIFI